MKYEISPPLNSQKKFFLLEVFNPKKGNSETTIETRMQDLPVLEYNSVVIIVDPVPCDDVISTSETLN